VHGSTGALVRAGPVASFMHGGILTDLTRAEECSFTRFVASLRLGWVTGSYCQQGRGPRVRGSPQLCHVGVRPRGLADNNATHSGP